MSEGSSIDVIGDLFRLTYVRNPGIAFGIDFAKGRVFHIVLSLIALVLIAFMVKRISRNQRSISYFFAIIFGGALGNLSDRIRMGEVIDFLDFGIGAYRWPVFNVADSAVTIGMFLVIFSYMFRGKDYRDGKESEHRGD